MSVDRCVECGRQADTDADTECYEDGDCCCWLCREKIVEGQEMDKRLDDPRRR